MTSSLHVVSLSRVNSIEGEMSVIRFNRKLVNPSVHSILLITRIFVSNLFKRAFVAHCSFPESLSLHSSRILSSFSKTVIQKEQGTQCTKRGCDGKDERNQKEKHLNNSNPKSFWTKPLSWVRSLVFFRGSICSGRRKRVRRKHQQRATEREEIQAIRNGRIMKGRIKRQNDTWNTTHEHKDWMVDNCYTFASFLTGVVIVVLCHNYYCCHSFSLSLSSTPFCHQEKTGHENGELFLSFSLFEEGHNGL